MMFLQIKVYKIYRIGAYMVYIRQHLTTSMKNGLPINLLLDLRESLVHGGWLDGIVHNLRISRPDVIIRTYGL